MAFTKPCLVRGIVKKASMEVRPWIACSLLRIDVMAPQHSFQERAAEGLLRPLGMQVWQSMNAIVQFLSWLHAMQGMRESYSRFRTLLLEHLNVAPGVQSRGALGNGGRPAVQQTLLLLLLGAAIILAIMVSIRGAITVRQLLVGV